MCVIVLNRIVILSIDFDVSSCFLVMICWYYLWTDRGCWIFLSTRYGAESLLVETNTFSICRLVFHSWEEAYVYFPLKSFPELARHIALAGGFQSVYRRREFWTQCAASRLAFRSEYSVLSLPFFPRSRKLPVGLPNYLWGLLDS